MSKPGQGGWHLQARPHGLVGGAWRVSPHPDPLPAGEGERLQKAEPVFPSPLGRGQGEGKANSSPPPPPNFQSKIQNPKSKIENSPGRPHIRIIGIGNEYREDDAAGLLVARSLQSTLPGHIDIIEQSGEGASLMDAWQGIDTVYLCDAVSCDAAPGTILRLDANSQPFPKDLRPCSSHAFGVAEAVELARSLGALPPRLILYGIAGKAFGAGTRPSPEVQSAINEAARQISAELVLLAT